MSDQVQSIDPGAAYGQVASAEQRNKVLRNTYWLLALSLLPTVLGACGYIYGTAALILSLMFVTSAVHVLRTDDLKPARQMFGFSVLYLFILLALMMADKV